MVPFSIIIVGEFCVTIYSHKYKQEQKSAPDPEVGGIGIQRSPYSVYGCLRLHDLEDQSTELNYQKGKDESCTQLDECIRSGRVRLGVLDEVWHHHHHAGKADEYEDDVHETVRSTPYQGLALRKDAVDVFGLCFG